MNATFTTTSQESVTHGDVAFEIDVTGDGNSFRHQWTCHTCGKQGESAAFCLDAATARALAKVAAKAHAATHVN
jgi:hypothetical protein